VGHAEAAVGRCRDMEWWCAGLSAHLMHLSGAWQNADSAWSLVLKRMAPEVRCAWLDPSPVISDRRLLREIRDYTCPELEEFASRFWWLSDPFLSKPGNERRSAHLSRVMTLTAIHWHRTGNCEIPGPSSSCQAGRTWSRISLSRTPGSGAVIRRV
jgi:hypothetical protein